MASKELATVSREARSCHEIWVNRQFRYPNLDTDAHSHKDAADAANANASTDTRPAHTHAACARRQTALCP
eukprot:1669696-Pleurochrysis_carterae.AAC.1